MTRIYPLSLIVLVLAWCDLSAQQRQLQVLVCSPKGPTRGIDQVQTVFAAFNQPMVALKEVPEDEDTGPLFIEPAVRGKYRWLGPTTITFTPSDTLPNATGFFVRIPAGTKSLSGQLLPYDFTWQFETPRPSVVNTFPSHGSRFVELDHAVFLFFSQKVDPSRASKFITVEERSGNQVTYPTFKVRLATPEEVKPHHGYRSDVTLVLIPDQPWKKGASITVTCKAGLPGIEGPLGMAVNFSLSFSTYSEFAFLRSSDRFSPSDPLKMIFSTPVSIREAAKHLVLSPPVKVDHESMEYDYTTDEVDLQLSLQPETEYQGRFLPGLKDRFAQELKADTKFRFRTGSFPPYVRMTTGPGVIEAYESHRYPIRLMNVDSVLVQMGRVSFDRIVPLMQKLTYDYYARLAWEEGILEWIDTHRESASELSQSKVWHLNLPKNKEAERPIELDQVLGKSTRGVALLQVDNLFPGERRRFLKALLQVTNLGITAKFSPDNNLIWVTNLQDALPIAGATIEVRNDSNIVLWSGTTGLDGLAKTPGWGKLGIAQRQSWGEEEYYESGHPRQWVLVRYKDDIAFTSSEWNSGIEPWIFGVEADWTPQFEPLQASVFTDRGLYKAAEQVEIKGIVRTKREGAWRIPTTGQLRLVVRDSRNDEIFSAEQKLSPFGSFAVTLSLKPTTPLGYYPISLQVKQMRKGKEQWENVGYAQFRVEAFRPAEFEVTALTGRKSYIVGDTVVGFISGRYLFGAPMKQEAVTWRFTASTTGWRPDGYEAYLFGPMRWLSQYSSGFGSRLIASGQGTLDEWGSAEIRSHLQVGEIIGTVSLMVEGDVTSKSRQTSSGRTVVTVHGGEYYIGISPSGTFVSSDSAFAYKLLAVTPEGKALPDVSLSIKLYQRIWRSVRKAETGGRYVWTSEVENVLVDSALVRSSTEPPTRSFRTKQAGFYFLEVQGKDHRGNQILSNAYFYVSGSSYVPWERTNDDKIELVTNKTDFSPGETASLIVKSPYEEALALISIEREGIIHHFTRKLQGSAPQIDIPILKNYLPNVFISVILLQGRVEAPAGKTNESDVGRPSFKIGYTSLSVSPKEKQLTVAVKTDRKEYRPGDSVHVTVHVKNLAGNGVRSEIALSVADLGVLNLIAYRLPNPFDEFYRQRGIGVVTTETRIHLVKQRDYGEKGEDEGGGGAQEKMLAALDAEGIRKNFRASAYWNPSLVTDADGSVTVSFRLPDNVTSFEVMAVAHSLTAEFGYGEQPFAVNKPLLMLPSLPRFARLGDSFEGGAVVFNYSDREKNLRLITEAKGIKFLGQDTSFHVMKPGQALEVRYKFVAEKIGKAIFTFRAKTDDDTDGLQWTIPIEAPRVRESVAMYESSTDPEAQQKVIIPKDIFTDLGNLEFTLASTALVGLSGGMSYLFEYPYSCLEQRASSILPMILAKELVEAFKFEVFKDKNYQQVVTRTLDEFPAFQRENGGFSYWNNVPWTHAYVSAYALYTAVQAKRQGYVVDKRMLDKGFEYLKRVLRGEEYSWYDTPYTGSCTQALILYTLALAGQPDYGYMEKLYENEKFSLNENVRLPLLAKAYLLKALSIAHANQAMIQDLARDLLNQAKIAPASAHFEERNLYGLEWIFHSNARTTALVMQALVETQPEQPLIPKVVRWLLDEQKAGRWRTTQENVYIVDALATYFNAYEHDEPNFRASVRVAGGELMKELFQGRSFRTATKDLAMGELTLGGQYPIDITKEGPGRVYYTIRMNYYPKAESKAKDEGLSILKAIETVKEPKLNKDAFRAGTVVKITLSVITNQARNFIVVNDPVPAGFEIIDLSLNTAGRNLTVSERQPHEGEWWHENPFNHRELHDDRALLFADYLPAGVHTFTYLARVTSYGTFSMPSTRGEGMYEPEVFGQTSSRIITVY
jgi:hypothetical protein